MRPSAFPVSLFVLAFLALAAHATAGDGAPPRARTSSLSWVRLPGAEECVATQALARAVEERLGRDAFVSAAQADVSVEGRASPMRGGGFRAVVTVRDAGGALLGTREVTRDGPSCDALTPPLALVIAVMIDPDAATGPRPAPPPPTKKDESPPPEVVVKREEVLVPVPGPAEPPPPPLFRFEGSAAVTGALGLLPSPAVGLAAVGMLEPRKVLPLPLIGFGGYFFDNVARGATGEALALSAFMLGAGFCPLWHRGRGASVYACALGHLGLLSSHPSGFTPALASSSTLLWDGGIDLRATLVVLGPFVVRMGAQGLVPLLRERFSYTPAQPNAASRELFRMAPVVGMVDLGVGLALP